MEAETQKKEGKGLAKGKGSWVIRLPLDPHALCPPNLGPEFCRAAPHGLLPRFPLARAHRRGLPFWAARGRPRTEGLIGGPTRSSRGPATLGPGGGRGWWLSDGPSVAAPALARDP